MKHILLNVFKGRVVSPWWILLIDLVLAANAYVIAFVLRLNFQVTEYTFLDFFATGSWVILIYLTFFMIYKSYKGVIRHTNYTELKLLMLACFTAFSFSYAVNRVAIMYDFGWMITSGLVLIFHFIFTLVFTFLFRVLVKETYVLLTKKKNNVNVVIYGASDLGLITLEALKNDRETNYNVVGFADDNPTKWNINLHSIPVSSWSKVLKMGDRKGINCVILAISNISTPQKYKIADECLKRNWQLKVMPSVGNWINGISNQGQIRNIRIEDLLGRDEIKLSQMKIMEGLEGKTLLISGAAGSIGSEIVRQVLKFPVKKVLMVDQAESALYELQQELLLSYYDAPFDVIIADITNVRRMEALFEKHKPDVVFNAAAYKHVPLMEKFPFEAIRVNIGGTKLLADLSIKHNVEKFVMVSTDKAVNPTNVMGATKRICEIYIQAQAQKEYISTSFITTRFGNVLGSNGSVVPLFKKQIERGGPVTVTDPDITRYFMTIPEACQLVLEAGFTSKGGEIFVFDMGEPVRISDLAKKMIRLAGLSLGEDIDIVYTGLRPGEKKYEELLASKENTLPTHHEKIMIGKVRQLNIDRVEKQVGDLLLYLNMESEELLVMRMKEIVPEFISQNSEFSALDRNPIKKKIVD